MMLILAGFAYLVLGEEKKRPSQVTPAFSAARFRQLIYAEVVSGTVFLSSALPFFWIQTTIGSFDTYLRFDIWYAVFAVFYIVLRFRAKGS